MVFHVKTEGSGQGITPGSSRGYEAGSGSSLNVLGNEFCRFFDASWSTCDENGSEPSLYPSDPCRSDQLKP